MTDYKATLNLPKTPFPMKGNLPQTEPKILDRWEKEHLFEKLLAAREKQPSFILHDGPPYANGDIHMGHALNKVLKDIIVRFELLQGKKVPYVPGWDCHGLPIEYALMKEMEVTQHEVNIVNFRQEARKYARRYVQIQRDQFKRLGVIGDWERPYLTLEPLYVAAALRALAKLVSKGFITRARKPVNWCWNCETALAEAEVEYGEHTSPSVYVKFPLEPNPKFSTGTSLVIWTTTPWTLTGNVAVAVHPEAEYAVWKMGHNEAWITLAQLPYETRQDIGLASASMRPQELIQGKKLEGLRYRHPLGIRQGQVVLADYVSMEEGTGLVHTAPGFGAEDYATGEKYGLEVLAPVDSKGQFVNLPEELSSLNGKQVQAANASVIKLLKVKSMLIETHTIEHSYPHCWRCHNPIIFRATDQWFLNIEHENLRQRLLEAVQKEVLWIPPEGKERMTGMIKTRPDWCLSRQRLWGIPIPAVICKICDKGILDPRVIENFAKTIENDPEGSDRWFSEPFSRWLPEGFQCGCGAVGPPEKAFKPGTDILDVWFDSGVSHEAVLRKHPHLSHPADLYLEGSDQHRGWFQVSLITGVALNGKPPYRGVLTHGFVVDGQGRKMSKSLGNVIAPQEVVSSLGSDVLRLWVASSDYREDVRISPVILNQMSEVYRKIRNTLRFCLANISDFDPAQSAVPAAEMEEQDRWILTQLRALIEEVTASYQQYAFHRVVKHVHAFCTVELSNFYLDVIKDCLYTSLPKDPKRLSAQTALAHLADVLCRLIAPILPMTAEEAWHALPQKGLTLLGQKGSDPGSIFFAPWPKAADFSEDRLIQEIWEQLLQLRDQAMKRLEEARASGLIAEALEAQLEIQVGETPLRALLQPRQELFQAACVVSSLQWVELPSKTAGDGVQIRVTKAPGAKCQRCWMHLPSVGESAQHPTLCHRCVKVLQQLQPR